MFKELRSFKKTFYEHLTEIGQEVDDDIKVDATKKDVEDGFEWIKGELLDDPDEYGGVVIFMSCHSKNAE